MPGGAFMALFLLAAPIFLESCWSGPDAGRPGRPSVAAAESGPAAGDGMYADASAEPDPFMRKYPLVELREDFEEFQKYIDLYHPKLYADRPAIASLLKTNIALLSDGMTELDLLRLLAPIVSRLNCGHSSISSSLPYQDKLKTYGRYFPLLLRFLDGKAWISGNGLHPELPIGGELLSINGLSMDQITETLFASLSADGQNRTRKYMLLNGWFRYSYQSFMDERRDYEITYRAPDSALIHSATIRGAADSEILQAHQGYFSERAGFYATPYEARFSSDYALLTMRSFSPAGSHSLTAYKSFIDDFFARVKADGIPAVILDVRDNSGGDPYVAAHLFSYLAGAAQPYFADSAPGFYPSLKRTVPLADGRFGGRLLVLMNGGSFSTTGHLLALLRSQSVGIFVGEESGGSFACTDASQTYTLRRTGLRFRSSTMVWEVAAPGLEPGRGIMPDYPVQPELEDFLSGQDSILDFALRLASRR